MIAVAGVGNTVIGAMCFWGNDKVSDLIASDRQQYKQIFILLNVMIMTRIVTLVVITVYGTLELTI